MWVPRLITLALFALFACACGGKSIKTLGGEAGSGSQCDDTECDGDCVDTSSDERNCGACDVRCDGDESCIDGRCRSGSRCELPATLCNGECVDVRFSQDHCGACNYPCGFGSSCNGGVCVEQCTSGQCGNRCVDFANDVNNCGGCGFTCGPTQYCSGGSCFESCELWSCGGECVDIFSDPRHCGGCFNQCFGPNAACISGGCQDFCPEGTLLCGDVCVDYLFDSSNCGGCGLQCADGNVCESGRCTNPCGMGTNCGGECVDTSNNPNHCGGCFFTCGPTTRCANGMCVMGGCGNRVLEAGEEADPPPGPLMVVPLDQRTCRYDFSRINQFYCNGSCGNWGGGNDCDQGDADAFCKLKMDNPRSTALSFSIVNALQEPGVCCPPPSFPAGALGCTSLGTLGSRGVGLNVSVHPTNLFSTHQGGKVVTNLVCTAP